MSLTKTTTTTVETVPSLGEKDASPGPVKRTWAKVRRGPCVNAHGAVEEVRHQILGVDGSPKDPSTAEAVHNTTSEYAGAASYAMVKEIAAFLRRDEGDAALRGLFEAQAQIVADMATQLLLSEELRRSFRMAGHEIMLGMSEGVERRATAGWQNLPMSVTLVVLPLCGIFACVFMLGLLLILWRFALFGQQCNGR